jgi:His-Xaa-Ser system protein HxsD
MADVIGREEPNRERRTEDAIVEAFSPVPAAVGSSGTAAVSVSREVYSRKAVLAAAYKLSDRCAVLVDTDGDQRWVLYLLGQEADDSKALLETLIKELADQALRDRLEQEFGAVRTLIVAQAFSEGNLLDPERDDADHHADARGTGQRR